MKRSSDLLNYSTFREDNCHQAMLDCDRHFDWIFASAVRQHWDHRALPPISIFLLHGRVVNMDQILSRYP
jgi:hypothetical protein